MPECPRGILLDQSEMQNFRLLKSRSEKKESSDQKHKTERNGPWIFMVTFLMGAVSPAVLKHSSMKGVCGFSSTSGLCGACVPDVPRLALLPSMKVCIPSFIRELLRVGFLSGLQLKGGDVCTACWKPVETVRWFVPLWCWTTHCTQSLLCDTPCISIRNSLSLCFCEI